MSSFDTWCSGLRKLHVHREVHLRWLCTFFTVLSVVQLVQDGLQNLVLIGVVRVVIDVDVVHWCSR